MFLLLHNFFRCEMWSTDWSMCEEIMFGRVLAVFACFCLGGVREWYLRDMFMEYFSIWFDRLRGQ